MAKTMTVREAGQIGGKKRADAGTDYAELGKKGGSETRKRGLDYYREIGRKGGAACAATHGPAHYAAIGKKGGIAGKGRGRQRG